MSEQVRLLELYVETLERENSAKNKETDSLYQEIDRLTADFRRIEQQLLSSRYTQKDAVKKELSIYSLQVSQAIQTPLRDRRAEQDFGGIEKEYLERIQQMEEQQQQLFKQNLHIMGDLQESERRIFSLEGENESLKIQKKELEKFRLSLEKIMTTLEGIEQQKTKLLSDNLQLIEENAYYRSVLGEEEGSLNAQNQTVRQSGQCKHASNQQKLTRLEMYNSCVETIEEYDEEYDEENSTNSNSLSRKSALSSKSGASDPEHLPECLLKPSDNSLGDHFQKSNRKKLNKSDSYLMVEQEPQNRSLDQQRVQFNQSVAKSPPEINRSNTSVVGAEDSMSCDVIQQESDSEQEHSERKGQGQALAPLKKEMLCLAEQNKKLKTKIKRMDEVSRSEFTEMEGKITEVIANYEKIEQINKEKDRQIYEMNRYILELEQQYLQQQQEKESLYEQLCDLEQRYAEEVYEDEISDKCMGRAQNSSENESLSQSDCLSDRMTTGEYELVRQNNELIERMASLEREKNYYYSLLKSSSSHSDCPEEDTYRESTCQPEPLQENDRHLSNYSQASGVSSKGVKNFRPPSVQSPKIISKGIQRLISKVKGQNAMMLKELRI